MPGKKLAQAWVGIGPDLQDFTQKANASLKEAMARVSDQSVKIGADTKPALTSVDALRAKIGAETRKVNEFRATLAVDDKLGQSEIAKFSAQLRKLGAQIENPKIDPEMVESRYLKISAQLDELAKDRKVKVDLDSSSASGLLGRLKSLFGNVDKDAQDAGGESGKGFMSLFQGGITGPAGIGAAVTLGLAVLPGAVAAAGGAAGIGLGAAILYATDTKFKAGVAALGTSVKNDLAAAVQDSGLAGALESSLGQVDRSLGTITGDMTQLFAAVTPLVRPFTGMFTDLARTVLPGFVTLMRDADAPLSQFFSTAGKILGSGLGRFFQQLGPSVGPSLGAVTSLLRITTELLPGLAGLAGILSHTLGPALTLVADGLNALQVNTDQATTSVKNLNGTLFKAAADNTTAWGKFVNAVVIAGQALTGQAKHLDGTAKSVDGVGAKAAAAAPKVGTLAGDTALLNSAVSSANTQLQAYNDIWNTLIGKSLAQQNAVLADKAAFDGLKSSMKQTGAQSVASQQAFVSYMQQVGNSIATLQQNGASVAAINSAYADSIGKLQSLHGLNKTQRKDISGLISDYDAWANSASGLSTQVRDASGAIKNQFIAQLGKMHADSPKVNTDISDLANSILKTGTNSSATKNDRQKLIADIEAAGGSAKTAKQLVDKLQSTITNMKGKSVDVAVHPKGIGQIVFQGTGSATVIGGGGVRITSFAGGGRVAGPGGPTADRVPIWASNGEYVMKAAAVAKYGLKAMDAINAGKFASGGPVVASSLAGYPAAAAGVESDLTGKALTLYAAKVAAAMQKALKTELAGGLAALPHGNLGSVLAEVNYAASRFKLYGWSNSMINDLMLLWTRESGWNPYAVNPSSGAYGIPQALGHGHPYNLGDAKAQIAWGENYIKQRYGNPAAAWAHEQSVGWYGSGGSINEPVVGWGTRSGRGYMLGEHGRETVTPAGGLTAGERVMIGLLTDIRAATQAAPVQFGRTLNRSIVRGVR